MEKRVAKIEADQASIKSLLIQIADGFLSLQSEVAQIRSELSDMRQTEADHHKETIGFLSKHSE